MAAHRKKLVAMYLTGCKFQLSCTDALNQYLVTHNDQCFDSPDSNCDKDFNTLSNLKQHLKGKHSEGLISYCGSSFDWSDNRTSHQKDCDNCKKLLYNMTHKPEFPGRRK